MGYGLWAMGYGLWAILTFLRTAIDAETGFFVKIFARSL